MLCQTQAKIEVSVQSTTDHPVAMNCVVVSVTGA